jgi:hypothetical protein
MARPADVVISSAVEGLVDEAVARRLVTEVGATPGAVYGRKGKTHLRERISSYNQAARWGPWLVLIDLDQDAECAPSYLEELSLDVAPQMCLRIAVREIESWLLADREQVARFLGLSRSLIPRDPESEADPKAALVALAARSRRRDVREDMLPRPGSRRSVGPAYSSRLIEFTENLWRPEVAARLSDSLNRALTCLRRLSRE